MNDISLHTQWIALSVAIIGALVRLLKSERIPAPLSRIPPKARPLVALLLGQLSGIIESFTVPGVSVRATIAGGLTSAAIAVISHDVLIEWWRDGKEVAQTKPPVEVKPEERVPPCTPVETDKK